MKQPRTSSRRLLIVIAATMTCIALAIPEAVASHLNALVGDPTTLWTVYIQQVDEALAQRNVSAAGQAWLDAFGAALKSRRWEGMIAVGEAYLRIGEVAGFRKAAEAKAHRIYLAALFRARQQGSLDGVLRAVEAFAALGDHEVAEQGLRIAQSLATQARDAQARDRVRETADRLTARVLTAPGP